MLSARRTVAHVRQLQLRQLATRAQLSTPSLSPSCRDALIESHHCKTLPVHLHRRAFTLHHSCREEEKPTSNSVAVDGGRTAIGQIEPRLAITFTCAVPDCGHRSTHEFSKRSYTKGIVIIQCPGCKNRHLIADNLSWFTETTDEPRNIEQIIEAKGGKVKRGTVSSDGLDGETIEIEDATDGDGKLAS